MKTLEQYIEFHSVHTPSKAAIECGWETITYARLWEAVKLRFQEIKKSGSRALVIRASQSIDFLIDYFACHLAGVAVVPLEHDTPQNNFDEILESVNSAVIPDEVADVLYTTGTTGKRKGTMLSQLAIISDAENLIDAQGFAADLTFVIAGPLNHIGSLSKIWPSVIVGATIKVLDGMKVSIN